MPTNAPPLIGALSNFQTVGDQYRALDPEEQRINKKQQIANLLMQKGLQRLPNGEMVGRFFVKSSPWQGVENLASLGAGMLGTHKMDTELKDLEAQRQQERMSAIENYFNRTADVPAVPPSTLNPQPQPQMAETPDMQGQGTPISMPQQPNAMAELERLLPENPREMQAAADVSQTLAKPNALDLQVLGNSGAKPENTGYHTGLGPLGMEGPNPWTQPPILNQQPMSMPGAIAGPSAFPVQGPVSPGTLARPRTPDEKQQAIAELLMHRDPRVNHFGNLMAQQQYQTAEHEASRKATALEHATQRAFLETEHNKDRLLKAQQQEAQLNQLLTLGSWNNEQKAAIAQQQADVRKEIASAQQQVARDNAKLQAATSKENAQLHAETQKEVARIAADAKIAAKQNPGMSATAQKELIETEEQTLGSQQALKAISQAMELNDKAMGFKGAGALAGVGSVLPQGIRPKVIDDTIELDNLVQGSALPQMKAIFGANPTEGERKVLLEVSGSSSQPASVRKGIFERAQAAINARIKFNTEKADRLRKGTYFSGEGGVNLAPSPTLPSAPSQGGWSIKPIP